MPSAEEHKDMVTHICETDAGNAPWTMAEIPRHIVTDTLK
jgi:hypothetical protein